MSHLDEYPPYSMNIEWEPVGGVFVVTVPELPGCSTHGTTYEEAVQQGPDAIVTWIDIAREDGEELPEPKCFDLSEDTSMWPEWRTA